MAADAAGEAHRAKQSQFGDADPRYTGAGEVASRVVAPAPCAKQSQFAPHWPEESLARIAGSGSTTRTAADRLLSTGNCPLTTFVTGQLWEGLGGKSHFVAMAEP